MLNPIITRHVLTIPASADAPPRRVHYRRCGSGPVLLMIHQSPRSSAEYEPLMREWAAHFTCIAPDTPGFGQSDPLPGEPEIADFADALCEFLDAAGIERCPAYGFHSGGIILVTALKREPRRFSRIAIGGYAIWTQAEMRAFGESYLPEFHPSRYGEHLAWLWSRMLEQSWVFPWFDAREQSRLTRPHDDPERVGAAVMEMLESGSAYRAGYGAVLRAARDIPPATADVPPCLISAYAGDPLLAHIDRLGEMPANWQARKVADPEEHQALSLAFLHEEEGTFSGEPAEDANEGWLALDHGLVHWRGAPGSRYLELHAPAGAMGDPGAGAVAIDVPGHGQSDPCDDLRGALAQIMAQLDLSEMRPPPLPKGDATRLYPIMTPDRFGAYLQRAWQIARAEAFFEPWYEASATSAIPIDPARLEPSALAARTLARIRAGDAARRYHDFLHEITGEAQ